MTTIRRPSPPTLTELPPPPPGKTGWPWTEETPALGSELPGGGDWPRFSIVTPSFGQGEFIEETIRSVLLQGYPEVEYIVMDGGSTDGTVEVLQRYAPWLSHWESVKDRGQTHAINKGLALATGEIFAYINSDDLFLPGAFGRVARAFAADPEASVVYGECEYVDERRRPVRTHRGRVTGYADYLRIWRRLQAGDFLTQPEVFCRTEEVRAGGGFREELRMVMDFEMWLRLLSRGRRFHSLHVPLAEFRCLSNQKSSRDSGDELFQVIREYVDAAGPPLQREERDAFEAELRRARAQWQLRAAIAANREAEYGNALRLCTRAVLTDPAVIGSYELWASLAGPAKRLVPPRLRSRLRDRVLRRRLGAG